ncbi:MAG: hypothetical protein ACOVT5_03380 [Armatimonadaceae bacterium]|jgi:hypothetical protein
MRRWAWVKAALLVLALVGAAWGVLAWLVSREPDWYAQAAAVAPQADDPAVAYDTQTRIGELLLALSEPVTAPGEWQQSFSPDELNAFLREGDDRVMILRPQWESVTDLRVSVDGDRLRVGARVWRGSASAVMSVELRVWLVAGEPNTIGVELVDVRQGGLPWFKRWLMDGMTGFAAKHDAEVQWYRGATNPVGICRLRVSQSQPDLSLSAVEVGNGRVTVSGRGLIGR